MQEMGGSFTKGRIEALDKSADTVTAMYVLLYPLLPQTEADYFDQELKLLLLKQRSSKRPLRQTGGIMMMAKETILLILIISMFLWNKEAGIIEYPYQVCLLLLAILDFLLYPCHFDGHTVPPSSIKPIERMIL